MSPGPASCSVRGRLDEQIAVTQDLSLNEFRQLPQRGGTHARRPFFHDQTACIAFRQARW